MSADLSSKRIQFHRVVQVFNMPARRRLNGRNDLV